MKNVRKLLALVMAVAIVCSLAISASATDSTVTLTNGATYDVTLTADATIPHTLDFFEAEDMTVEVSDAQATITIPVADPATVTVTVGGTSYTSEGTISAVTCSTTGYTVSLVNDNLVIVCDASKTVDVKDSSGNVASGTFAPVITFTVDITQTEGSVTTHRSVPATLRLVTAA